MIPKTNTTPQIQQSRLIETDDFPFEFLSIIAERESWRKEIYRPIYHLHKWWAKRLGSIFRGILLGSLLPPEGDLEKAFYQRHDFSGLTVFDPFMGSGTTIGEAHKLGCTALGRDINPVACESVRIALGPLDRGRLQDAFSHLAATVGRRIRELYQSADRSGRTADVLYYFWVKQATCPYCAEGVDLFSTRVVAQNAYPDRKPEIQVCCPRCGDIFSALNHERQVCCCSCGLRFDPNIGHAKGAKATCPSCARSFSIAEAVRNTDRPPAHRLYGKLLLTAEEKKCYLPATSEDIKFYQSCSNLLQRELKSGALRLPSAILADGFNTKQAIGYNYRRWHEFFNDRQLLALGWLHTAISELQEASTRDAFLNLFSGVLEFNNLFASYKGEGTGAVRHMFSHHILKPERMPIEANVWGTAKSSGSFSNLFKARLFRALDYRAAPFEARTTGSSKAYQCSPSFSGEVEISWPGHGNFKPRGIYLSCGSSNETDLPDNCVDAIVTDPPFFDNVHYSELADFFHAWQTLYPRGFINGAPTTRHALEVQDTNADNFAVKLRAVFSECRRVLKDEGILVFTYHHSRAEGWASLMKAVLGAGFYVANAHPVKAELSVATPKSQAKEPIQLDVIMVCRKTKSAAQSFLDLKKALVKATKLCHQKQRRLEAAGLKLSQNDRRIIMISQYIAALGQKASADFAIQALLNYQEELEKAAENSYTLIDEPATSKYVHKTSQSEQMTFLFNPVDL